MRVKRSAAACGAAFSLLTLVGAGDDGKGRQPPVSAGPTSAAQRVQLKQCLVSLIHDVEVPAREAGVLTKVEVHEGQEVKAQEPLAQVDDERARAQRQVAEHQLQHAEATAANDVNVRYSKAASNVSQAEVAEAEEANRTSAGAVAAAEVRRLQLTSRRAALGIEQAESERHLNDLASKVRAAELRAAESDVQRRVVVAPVAGMVVEVFKEPGEWVQAGEAILRIVQLQRLRVEGYVHAEQLGCNEVAGCQVTVAVRRQRGRIAQFTGKVVFVNPIIEASGNYRVWAEVDNRQEQGHWLLQPGMEAQMTIDLKSPLDAVGEPKVKAE